MNNRLSVLMSLYEKENELYFNDCLDSIYKQSLSPSEVILVIDGPISLKLESVIEKWICKLPIILIRLEQNLGLSAALNIGLSKCSYELVARMDTDDICHVNRFETQIKLMTDSNIDICGSFAIDIDENGKEISERKVPQNSESIKKFIWSCPVIHPSVMFRKSSILLVGSYNVDNSSRQDDYELWIRCVNNGLIFYNIPEYLIYYRYPVGSENKNSFLVGFNRFKIGIKAALKYDPGFRSFIGCLYPMLRPIIPSLFRQKLISIAKRFDPRS